MITTSTSTTSTTTPTHTTGGGGYHRWGGEGGGHHPTLNHISNVTLMVLHCWKFQVCFDKGSRLAIWIRPVCWTWNCRNWLSCAVLAFAECSRSGPQLQVVCSSHGNQWKMDQSQVFSRWWLPVQDFPWDWSKQLAITASENQFAGDLPTLVFVVVQSGGATESKKSCAFLHIPAPYSISASDVKFVLSLISNLDTGQIYVKHHDYHKI